MKTKILLFTFILFLIPKSLLPQTIDNYASYLQKKNQIGIQLNPYLDEEFFHGLVMNTVYAIRYGYKISEPITIGAEFSGYFPYFFSLSNPVNYYNINFGIFSRYSFWDKKRIQGFIELSPYYSYRYQETSQYTSEIKQNKFGVYVAPGISFFSKNKKISVDLYYKFSNLTFVNSKKSVISYKVNYNF